MVIAGGSSTALVPQTGHQVRPTPADPGCLFSVRVVVIGSASRAAGVVCERAQGRRVLTVSQGYLSELYGACPSRVLFGVGRVATEVSPSNTARVSRLLSRWSEGVLGSVQVCGVGVVELWNTTCDLKEILFRKWLLSCETTKKHGMSTSSATAPALNCRYHETLWHIVRGAVRRHQGTPPGEVSVVPSNSAPGGRAKSDGDGTPAPAGTDSSLSPRLAWSGESPKRS